MYQLFSFTGIYGIETPLVGYDPLVGETVVRDNMISQNSYFGIFWKKEEEISLQGFFIDAKERFQITGSLVNDNIIITRFGRSGETLFHLIKERELYVGKYSGEKNVFTKLSLTKLENGFFRISAEQEKLLKKP